MGAIQFMQDIIAQFQKPGDPDYHNNMGLVYRDRGELKRAIGEFRKAIRLQPDDVMFHCNLASALAAAGELEVALEEYRLAVEINPNDAPTHYNLGNLYRNMDRLDEALVEYEQAIQLEPEREEFNCAVADCYMGHGRDQEAMFHYLKALTDTPNPIYSARVHRKLGILYHRQHALDKAEAHLLDAYRLSPKDFMTNYVLAGLYLQMESDDVPAWIFASKALLHAKKAVEAEPSDLDARRLIVAAGAAFDAAEPPDFAK